MWKKLLLLMSALVTVACLDLAVCAEEAAFQVTGIGGAGGMYTPVASPYDPNFMLVSSDMSGCYRSTDGGRRWEMIHYQQMRSGTGCRPSFFKDAILWASGTTLKVSRDQGVTWQSLPVGAAPWKGAITKVAGVAAGPDNLVAFVGNDEGLWRSADGGKTWQPAKSGKCWEVTPVGTKVFASVDKSLYVSDDQGKTWQPVEIAEQKGHSLSSVTGAVGPDGSCTLYATAWSVGILQSRDGGKTWRVSQGWTDQHNDQNIVLMAGGQTRVAYAAQSGGSWCRKVWRTTNGGDSWEECFHLRGPKANVEASWVQTELRWGYYITPIGLGIGAGDPNLVLLTTQGDFYISRDGAKTWQQTMNLPAQVEDGGKTVWGYRCNGLEVTTNWKYLFDPFDEQRTYIAYTDIGFARSRDRGQTWIWSASGCPWSNTFYHVVFDPKVKVL